VADVSTLAQLVADLHQKLRRAQVVAMQRRVMLNAALELLNEVDEERTRYKRSYYTLLNEVRLLRAKQTPVEDAAA
jgi:hypothetical protein